MKLRTTVIAVVVLLLAAALLPVFAASSSIGKVNGSGTIAPDAAKRSEAGSQRGGATAPP